AKSLEPYLDIPTNLSRRARRREKGYRFNPSRERRSLMWQKMLNRLDAVIVVVARNTEVRCYTGGNWMANVLPRLPDRSGGRARVRRRAVPHTVAAPRTACHGGRSVRVPAERQCHRRIVG